MRDGVRLFELCEIKETVVDGEIEREYVISSSRQTKPQMIQRVEQIAPDLRYQWQVMWAVDYGLGFEDVDSQIADEWLEEHSPKGK